MKKNSKAVKKGEKTEKAEKQLAPADYLMWVGSIYYPTVDDYIGESQRLGVCKRIGKLPTDLVPGHSRVFLAHDDGIVGEGFVFGYFIPNQIQYLTTEEERIPENLYDRVVWITEWEDEEERECGERREGMYIVTFAAEAEDEDDEFEVFDRPRDLNRFDPDRPHFRGLLQIDYGDKLVNAKRGFRTPPSRKAHEVIDPKTPWTPEEDEALMALFEAEGNKNRAAQKHGYKTGRSKGAGIYRINLLTKGSEDEEDAE